MVSSEVASPQVPSLRSQVRWTSNLDSDSRTVSILHPLDGADAEQVERLLDDAADRSTSSRRLSLSSGVSAFSTGQFSKKPLKLFARSHRYAVMRCGR